jgi:hypothetical protein
MAAGRSSLAAGFDLHAAAEIEERIAQRAVTTGAAHAALLRDVLELHSVYSSAGMSVMTAAQVALSFRCSEWKAHRLLTEAVGLGELPGALEALEAGVLQVDQCLTVVRQLADVTPSQRLELWQRLLTKLERDAERGAVLTVTRLADLLKKWVLQIAPAEAVEQRQAAEEDRTVGYRKREDGLADIFLIGIRATDAQAILQRIRAGSAPVTGWDERTIEQRRLDAAVDLLLGRDVLGTGTCAGSGCACLPGQAAPCGADVAVFVPHASADGRSDEPATLVGHGPIERDLLQGLLLNAARLRPVFLDERGVPVGIGTAAQTRTPIKGDPASLRQALGELAQMRPTRLFPRDPDDHPPPETAHPPGTPGAYQVTGALRDLIFTRAPRCEWPGCGWWAGGCDAEHDLAHPAGPTCACNLGPLCRHHHRIKQLGWTKTRHRDGGLTWIHPDGRQWLSPAQHQPPEPAVRPAPPLPPLSEWDEPDPDALAELLWILDGRQDDPVAHDLRAEDVEPPDTDPYDPFRDTRWTWDLDDPYAWLPEPAACSR